MAEIQLTQEEWPLLNEYQQKRFKEHVNKIHEYLLDWDRGIFGNWWDGIDYEVECLESMVILVTEKD